MGINAVYGSSYSAFTQSTKAIETEATEKTSKMSEAEEMAAFKKEFYADLERITNHRTVYSWSVNIFIYVPGTLFIRETVGRRTE